jgi:hypothetical protein
MRAAAHSFPQLSIWPVLVRRWGESPAEDMAASLERVDAICNQRPNQA